MKKPFFIKATIFLIGFIFILSFKTKIAYADCGSWVGYGPGQVEICSINGTSQSGIKCSLIGQDCCKTQTECDQLNPPSQPSSSNPQIGCPANQINTALGCLPTEPQAFATVLFSWSLGIAGVAALLLISFGAIQHALAAGNPEKLQQAREVILSAITGLVIIILSVTILKIVGVDILGIFSG